MQVEQLTMRIVFSSRVTYKSAKSLKYKNLSYFKKINILLLS